MMSKLAHTCVSVCVCVCVCVCMFVSVTAIHSRTNWPILMNFTNNTYLKFERIFFLFYVVNILVDDVITFFDDLSCGTLTS